MEPILLRASEESKNQRLDAFLASSLDGLTRSQATRLIESGEVAVNGRAVSKSYKLAGGEDIAVTLPEPEPVEAVPQDIPLDVVYEDADVIVVNKPSGMVVHPAPGHPDGTLVNALLYHCAGYALGRRRRAAPRHRPPHRPRHERSHHRGEERRGAPVPLRAARRPHARAHLRVHCCG